MLDTVLFYIGIINSIKKKKNHFEPFLIELLQNILYNILIILWMIGFIHKVKIYNYTAISGVIISTYTLHEFPRTIYI